MPAILPWLMSAATWIKRNPFAFIQGIVVATLVAGAVFLYFDYKDAKADRAELRAEAAQLKEQIEVEKALTKAATDRINEFALSQEQQIERLKSIEAYNVQTRAQVRAALKGLSAGEVKQVIQENPDEDAAAILSDRFNGLLGLFDYEDVASRRPAERR
jgi:hypothetical protein